MHFTVERTKDEHVVIFKPVGSNFITINFGDGEYKPTVQNEVIYHRYKSYGVYTVTATTSKGTIEMFTNKVVVGNVVEKIEKVVLPVIQPKVGFIEKLRRKIWPL